MHGLRLIGIEEESAARLVPLEDENGVDSVKLLIEV